MCILAILPTLLGLLLLLQIFSWPRPGLAVEVGSVRRSCIEERPWRSFRHCVPVRLASRTILLAFRSFLLLSSSDLACRQFFFHHYFLFFLQIFYFCTFVCPLVFVLFLFHFVFIFYFFVLCGLWSLHVYKYFFNFQCKSLLATSHCEVRQIIHIL